MVRSEKEKQFWKWHSKWIPNPTWYEWYLRLEDFLLSLLRAILSRSQSPNLSSNIQQSASKMQHIIYFWKPQSKSRLMMVTPVILTSIRNIMMIRMSSKFKDVLDGFYCNKYPCIIYFWEPQGKSRLMMVTPVLLTSIRNIMIRMSSKFKDVLDDFNCNKIPCIIYFWKPQIKCSWLVVMLDIMMTIRKIRMIRNVLQFKDDLDGFNLKK